MRWPAGPHTAELASFLALLAVAGAIGLFVVLVRRLFVPSRETLESAFVRLTDRGIWKIVSRRRRLLIGSSEIEHIVGYRTSVNWLLRVEFEGKRRSISIHDLDGLESFLAEARARFTRARFRQDKQSHEDLRVSRS